MVAQPWVGFKRGVANAFLVLSREQKMEAEALASAKGEHAGAESSKRSVAPAAWQLAATMRRRVLLLLVVLTTCCMTALLASTQPLADHTLLRVAHLSLFALLFAWVAAGFFTAMMGFWVQLRGDPHAISAAGLPRGALRADARTAVIMPICNEQVTTVFAGLRATCESLAATGAAELFDVYVLSDTADPALRAAEIAAWESLRNSAGTGVRVYYRWRERRTRRKAGNVADFCRRWGRNYLYMVVLDADSVMTGECLVTLVRLMEAHPQAGIIQTAPRTCGADTLHARAQQFAGRVAGRLFTMGMRYWQLGESHYWGHNAIIRVEPFMRHCGLAALTAKDGSKQHVLSHDFMEAALMGRAGYQTWLVSDLEGSYEQQPANLLEELQRDRRWCQGNMLNARLIAEPGLSGVHRAMLATGVMAYASAPLWLAYLLLGSAIWLLGESTPPAEVSGMPVEMIGLWAATALMLFLPRVLGVATIVLNGEQSGYGGTVALIKGAVLEAGLSMFQAPLRMIGHTVSVLVAVTGLSLEWKSPAREAQDIGWGTAGRYFALLTGVLAVLMLGVWLINPGAIAWMLPVVLPLVLAVPFTVLTSQTALGKRLRASRLLLIPEELRVPGVLQHAWSYAKGTPIRLWAERLARPTSGSVRLPAKLARKSAA
jgi:membrane glycosyltransferase